MLENKIMRKLHNILITGGAGFIGSNYSFVTPDTNAAAECVNIVYPSI